MNAINSLEPRAGTSIFLGLKWGVTLLDPSFQSVISALPSATIDPAFDDRPESYDAPSGVMWKTRSLKYLVLMTDGYNDNSWRLKDSYYTDPSYWLYWAKHNLPWVAQDRNGGPDATISEYRNSTLFYTRDQGVGYMDSMCEAARNAGIIIYAISMSGDETSDVAVQGAEAMARCAGDANRFFVTSGPELDQIFERIAQQITDLRLTQ
ncbi:hypothetical protein ACOI1H_18090 [Loktanella sp. DJP18]|uniref:hypothetical protein n=1 Tax=Loktanella sp. DJP18 TaxID=3409788 RepID=UPI003BB4F516